MLDELEEYIDKNISWNKLVLGEMKAVKYIFYSLMIINGIWFEYVLITKAYSWIFVSLIIYVLLIYFSNINIKKILKVQFNIESVVFGGRKEFCQIKLSRFIDYLKSQRLYSIEMLEILLREGNIEVNHLESNYFKVLAPLLCILIGACIAWIYGNIIKTFEMFIYFTSFISVYIVGLSISLSGLIDHLKDFVLPKRAKYENMVVLLRGAVMRIIIEKENVLSKTL